MGRHVTEGGDSRSDEYMERDSASPAIRKIQMTQRNKMTHSDWPEIKSCVIAIGAEVVGGARLPERGYLEGSQAVFSDIWERNTILSFFFFFPHVYILHVYQEKFLVYAEGNVSGDIRHGVALTVKCGLRPRHPSLAGNKT